MPKFPRRRDLPVSVLLLLASPLAAADWPTFRHDNQRSGTTTETLPVRWLERAWTWQAAHPPRPAWAGPAKWDAFAGIRGLRSMRDYDSAFHVAVAGDRVFFASSADDTVRALDARSGAVLWTYTADAPVRITPSVDSGRVYFGSDDGHAYCLGAADGKLQWRYAPVEVGRRILHDGRLVSLQPCRTGVLVDRGTAYFAMSLLPWRDSWLCAVDARTGVPRGPGRFVTQHSGATFEGPLLTSTGQLIAPQGRVEPLLFARDTGKKLGALKGGGGCFVLVTPDSHVLHGPGNKTGWITQSDAATREKVAAYKNGRAVVVAGDVAYLLTDDAVFALARETRAAIWRVESQWSHDLIFAGGTLFAGGTDEVAALDARSGELVWRAPVPGRARGLTVASGSLFVSTDTGAIVCFRRGSREVELADARRDDSSEAAFVPEPIPAVDDATLLGRWVLHSGGIAALAVRDQAGNHPGRIEGRVRVRRSGGVPGLEMAGDTTVVVADDFRTAGLPEQEMSATAWVRVDQPLSWGGIVGAFQDNGGFERGWILGFIDRRFSFGLKAAGGKNAMTYMKADRDFEMGRWHHVAGTYDGRSMRLWVDGRLTAESGAQAGKIHYPEKGIFEIGAYHDENEFFPLRGAISEVRVYRRALTAADVQAQAAEREPEPPPPPPPAPPAPAELAFGPVLRFTRPGQAVVRWRTSGLVPTVLEYEVAGEVRRVRDPRPKPDHEVVLAGLRHRRSHPYRIFVERDGELRATKDFECDTFFDYSVPAVAGDVPAALRGRADDACVTLARRALAVSGVERGICLVLGGLGGRLAWEIASRSDLRVIVLDTDEREVETARRALVEAGIYGSRVAVHLVESLASPSVTPHFANLLVSGEPLVSDRLPAGPIEVLSFLRPGGGVAVLGASAGISGAVSENALRRWARGAPVPAKVEKDETGVWSTLTRQSFPGAGEWSHQYGRPDNSSFGGEALAGSQSTGDLAVQWFGRPGPRAQADRNGRKPAPLSTGGRLFVQGLHRLVALDAYNGSILWSIETPVVERFNMPRDCSNWCADQDTVFVAARADAWGLDAATGAMRSRYRVLPGPPGGEARDWGYIARHGELLLGTSVRAGTAHTNFWGGAGAGWYDATSGPVTDKICADVLFALDVDDGTTRWKRRRGLVIHPTIAVTDGRVVFVETRNETALRSPSHRVGLPELWQDQFLVALDAKSGETVWETPLDTADGTVVFYLSAGEGHLVILSSTNKRYHVYGFSAVDGRSLWQSDFAWKKGDHGAHMSRPAIVDGLVYVRPRVFDLATGERLGPDLPDGGCGTYAVCEGALIFRAGNVTLWSRTDGKTSSWSRLRPDCWLSTIPAAGMLLSPEAGGGCSCGKWLETSIGFLPKARLRGGG